MQYPDYESLRPILTEAERALLRDRAAKELADIDNDAVLPLLGAVSVIGKMLGSEWFEEHVRPNLFLTDVTYFRKGIGTDLRSFEWTDRVVQLAILLDELRVVKGFQPLVHALRHKLLDRDLDALIFELRTAYRLIANGHHVHFVARRGVKGADYDLDCWIDETRIAIEVETKRHDTAYSEKTLLATLRHARGQLPKARPGAVVVKVPTAWAVNGIPITVVEKGIADFLRNTRRVNAVTLYWDTVDGGPPFRRISKFRTFSNPQPRVLVNGIEKIFVERTTAMTARSVRFI